MWPLHVQVPKSEYVPYPHYQRVMKAKRDKEKRRAEEVRNCQLFPITIRQWRSLHVRSFFVTSVLWTLPVCCLCGLAPGAHCFHTIVIAYSNWLCMSALRLRTARRTGNFPHVSCKQGATIMLYNMPFHSAHVRLCARLSPFFCIVLQLIKAGRGLEGWLQCTLNAFDGVIIPWQLRLTQMAPTKRRKEHKKLR